MEHGGNCEVSTKIKVTAQVSHQQGPCFAARQPSEHSEASGTAGTRPRAAPAAATCGLCRGAGGCKAAREAGKRVAAGGSASCGASAVSSPR